MSFGRSRLVGKLMSLGLPREHAARAVAVVLGRVGGSLRDGGEVAIRGFGTFLLKPSRRSVMFDPRAGRSRKVDGGTLVRFRPSRKFEDGLKGVSG